MLLHALRIFVPLYFDHDAFRTMQHPMHVLNAPA